MDQEDKTENVQINLEQHQNINRDNLFVKIMKIVMPVLFIVSLGAFLFASGMFDGLFEPEKEARAKPAQSTVMQQAKITRFDKKSRTYALTAKEAVQDKDRPEIVSLDQVEIVVNMINSGQTVNITSDNGLYDSKAEELALSRNIIVISDNGYKAELSQALINLPKGKITSLKPVTVYMPQGKVTSGTLDITENGNMIHFKNRAVMTLENNQ